MILTLGLAAGTAQAQIQPPKNPYAISPPTLGSTAAAGTFKPYEGYQPPKAYAPPMPTHSVYEDGAFSPGGGAKRERRAAAAERARENGVFSPAGEAKRQREQARRDKALSPY